MSEQDPYLRAHAPSGGAADETAAERAAPPPDGLRMARRIAKFWESRGARRARVIGLPILVGVVIGAGGAAFPPTRDAAIDAYESVRSAFLSRPEFRLSQIKITGARELSNEALSEALGVEDHALASLSYDVHAARARVEALGWVETADITVRPPQTLLVDIVERVPAAVWREGRRLTLMDASGVVIAQIENRVRRPGLPLLIGPGAGDRVPEAIRLHSMAIDAGMRPVGMTRIGARRWDVEVLDGPRIMLPEHNPEAALGRAIRWARDAQLLERGFERVDLRTPYAPTARLSETAFERVSE